MVKTHVVVLIATVLTSSLIAGCSGDSESEATARLTGSAAYRDAETDHAGAERPASSPPVQTAEVSIIVKGTGELPQVDPQCALDPAGHFEAHYLSNVSLSEDALYVATFASGSGAIATPSGCTIPELTVGVVTDVVVHAELEVTTENCETYCQAHARAEAEATCGATATAAACRADAEAQTAASCTTTCTTQAHAIAAEVSLGAAVLGQIDAAALEGAVLGNLEANLTFDHLIDASGDRL